MKNKKFFIIVTLIVTVLLVPFTLAGCNKSSDTRDRVNENPTTITDDEGKGEGLESNYEIADFFPMKKDTYMKYKGIGNEYAEYETYVEFIKDNVMQVRDINPGTFSALVYEIKDGELKRLLSKGEVYYRYDYTDVKEDAEILIKEPIEKGTSWTVREDATRTITDLNKEVSTPMGDYEALEITMEGKDYKIFDYYVKDIGLVKTVYKSKEGDFTVISELENMETNTPLIENVRFFYPDFNQDRLVYIEKDIELYTNDTVEPIFVEELQNIPKDSELSQTIPDKVNILGIKINSAPNGQNDSITVDFTSNFVAEMNAGTSLESMILNSIANTFGSYFQTEKVSVTLEGDNYSSGHILLEADDFIPVDLENSFSFR